MRFLKRLICLFFVLSPVAHAFTIFNLNVFDELQGEWGSGFREQRMGALAEWLKQEKPDLVVFQEAKGTLPGAKKGGQDSVDAQKIRALYPYRYYVYEMTGKDGAAYGYWIGAKRKPHLVWSDGFFFPGGVERKTQGAVWKNLTLGGKKHQCLGVLSVHLSYQTSEVRVREAKWITEWIKGKEMHCKRWVVMGDFNADDDSPEIRELFSAGFKSLFTEKKPTVGAFNPIRRIYGADIPSKTIDWVLGWGGIGGAAHVVLDAPVGNVWISDHAGVRVEL